MLYLLPASFILLFIITYTVSKAYKEAIQERNFYKEYPYDKVKNYFKTHEVSEVNLTASNGKDGLNLIKDHQDEYDSKDCFIFHLNNSITMYV